MSAERRRANLPLLVTGAVVLLVAFSAWQTVRLAQENAALRGALEEIRSHAPAISSRTEDSSSAQLEQTRVELEQARTQLRVEEAKASELASTLAVTVADELKSFGRLEELAGKGVQLVNAVHEHQKAIQTTKLAPGQTHKSLRFDDLSSLIVDLEVIGKLESNPAEVAELHAQALQQILDLDGVTSRRVRESLASEFEQLRTQGLDRMQRPTEGEEDWYARRDQALLAAAARIEGLISPEKRSPNAVVQIMNLGTGLRPRMARIPDGPPGRLLLFYKEPGSEPIQVETNL